MTMVERVLLWALLVVVLGSAVIQVAQLSALTELMALLDSHPEGW